MFVKLLEFEPIRILIISASPRSDNNCPDEIGKSKRLVDHLLSREIPGVEYDLLDLAVRGKIVQPCKGCVSTAGPHCHYPCTCYSKGNKNFPDLMHDEDIYHRLELCHGFLVVTPIHWYSIPTSLKAMFDRLVCINGGNPWPELTCKDKRLSRRLEILPEVKLITRNHLAGRSAAFYVFGDNGANELGEDDYPWFMRQEDKDYPPETNKCFVQPESAVMPIAMQCLYSGIHVDKNHIVGEMFGENIPYGLNNVTFHRQEGIFNQVDELIDSFIKSIRTRLKTIPRMMPYEEKEKDRQTIDFEALIRKIYETNYPD